MRYTQRLGGCAGFAAALMLSGCSASEREGASGALVSVPRFNQRLLEYLWAPSARMAGRLPSELSGVDAAGLDIEDPASLARFVLLQAPRDAVVYPTEHYYYYEFIHDERRIAGNLRFTDIADGVLHVGYFDRFDGSFLKYAPLGPADGLATEWDAGSRTARVSLGGVSRVFRVPVPSWPEPVLAEGEVLIARVLDESGFGFDLIYHEPTAQFYDLLAEGAALPDRLVRVHDGPAVELGVRSRFVFVTDPLGRRVLVGVYRPSIAANNYYDGPFDQVPPDLSIRERLEAAYPYVKMRGGIDEHGVFREIEGERVAISPYTVYGVLDGLLARIEGEYDAGAGVPGSFASLVYEPKRDAHLRLGGVKGPEIPDGLLGRARTWPATHWQRVSLTWPSSHEQRASVSARANEPLEDGE